MVAIGIISDRVNDVVRGHLHAVALMTAARRRGRWGCGGRRGRDEGELRKILVL